jgi:hypothetical protein
VFMLLRFVDFIMFMLLRSINFILSMLLRFIDVGEHRTDHSESGETTAEAFQRWLTWLRVGEDEAPPLG